MSKGKDGLAGRVLVAAGIVDYQEGAVVSREIVRGEKGSITVLRSTRGKG
nr:hypothetical protein [Candidatus Solincola tengchongensis]